MKAIVRERYGQPEVLQLRDVDVPVVGEHQLLVRVAAASVNPMDWHLMTGVPYIARPGNGWLKPGQPVPGTDMAGRVEAVGAGVTKFQPGDEVFGMRSGAFAEYVVAHEDRVVAKPANVSFEEAAAVPVAGLTALQALRDKGGIKAGQKVLVNGASGGVGTFAVQLAKHFGGEVTAVCSTRNVDAVRALGADHVIDYTREDFTRTGERYNLILDVAGTRSVADRRRALALTGTLVMVGGPKDNRWVGPAGGLLKLLVASRFGQQRMIGMLARNNRDDLDTLRALLESGRLKAVVERTYPLRETPEAMRYVGAGHAQGKVVITI